MTKSTSQVLQEARALVEQGWCQGNYHQGPRQARQHCVAGAVNLSTARRTEREPVFAALEAALPASFCGSLTGFNDLPTMTQAGVLALIDRALVEVTK